MYVIMYDFSPVNLFYVNLIHRLARTWEDKEQPFFFLSTKPLKKKCFSLISAMLPKVKQKDVGFTLGLEC